MLEWLPPALDADLVEAFDLTHFEYGVLFALADAPDHTLGMSTLAGYANSSLSRLSRAVSRLEGRGWIQRSQSISDRRSTLATLTEEGSEVFHRAAPVHTQTVKNLVLDPLTKAQRRQLHEISRRIQRAIRDEEGWQPDRNDRRSDSDRSGRQTDGGPSRDVHGPES
ncbi:MarR family winged helix-turn-helix transcriptional regulator [Nesterenkonia sp. F]|uniref:MarR family winged helix-turn-helix transcriptional regulator n=1 Tax=Nesterenkonia sp. F TaxID=795955 RepID=UPI000255D57E|nr:MarR family transcriptional regulator [Nesterenkonia sp. F]